MSITSRLLGMLSLSDRQLSTEDEEGFEKWGYFSMLPVSRVSIHNKLKGWEFVSPEMMCFCGFNILVNIMIGTSVKLDICGKHFY